MSRHLFINHVVKILAFYEDKVQLNYFMVKGICAEKICKNVSKENTSNLTSVVTVITQKH